MKKGYELTCDGGYLELEDGSKWSVINAHEGGFPSFDLAPHLFGEYNSYDMPFEANDWNKTGTFNFFYNEGGPNLQWSEETQKMEEDPLNSFFSFEVFSLNVKRFLETSTLLGKK